MALARSLRLQVEEYQRWSREHHRLPTVSELPHRLGISRVTLAARFRRETGKTLGAYFNAERLQYINDLLSTTQLSIAQIATRAGYQDHRSLHRAFRRATRLTPADFRRRNA